MTSREKILKEIAQNKPPEVPLPSPFVGDSNSVGMLEKFLTVLHAIGGSTMLIEDERDVQSFLHQQIDEGKEVVNCIANLSPFHGEKYVGIEARLLEAVHTVFIRGDLAVAENASIWVPETAMVNRALPFICQELVMVINEASIVAHMHQAYAQIDISQDGYGVFIAGPSKTADIEQSLVIGAHGPLSLRVFIVKENPGSQG